MIAITAAITAAAAEVSRPRACRRTTSIGLTCGRLVAGGCDGEPDTVCPALSGALEAALVVAVAVQGPAGEGELRGALGAAESADHSRVDPQEFGLLSGRDQDRQPRLRTRPGA